MHRITDFFIFAREKASLEMGWRMTGNVDASSWKRSHHVASWISRGWLRWNAGMLRKLKRSAIKHAHKLAIVLWIMGWERRASVHRAGRVSSVPSCLFTFLSNAPLLPTKQRSVHFQTAKPHYANRHADGERIKRSSESNETAIRGKFII